MPLGEVALDWLDRFVRGPRSEILDGRVSEAVFPSRRGDAMTRQAFWMIIKRHAARAGIVRPVTPIPCATRSPPTSSTTARTFGSSSSCSATATSRPPRSTPTSPASGFAPFTPSTTPGADAPRTSSGHTPPAPSLSVAFGLGRRARGVEWREAGDGRKLRWGFGRARGGFGGVRPRRGAPGGARRRGPGSGPRSGAQPGGAGRARGHPEGPLPGFYEVRARGEILYVSADGRFLLHGNLYAVETRRNLTEDARRAVRRDVIGRMDEDALIVFAPAGATRHRLTVFTDVDCPYCSKFHLEVPDLNDSGVEVRYAAWPRTPPGTQSHDRSISVWCAQDRHQAMTDAKAGRAIAHATCENPVQEHYELGRRLGVSGTPPSSPRTARASVATSPGASS